MSIAARLLRLRPRPEQQAVCPTDHLTFTPAYTDGVCPLCGYRPEGIDATPPLSARIDRFWTMLVVWAAVSVAMLILVVIVYVRA